MIKPIHCLKATALVVKGGHYKLEDLLEVVHALFPHSVYGKN